MSSETIKPTRPGIIEHVRTILESWVSDTGLIGQVDEETNLITDLGLDSIGILQVILQAERDFGISIENNELGSETFSKIGNLVNIIQDKMYAHN